jgi:hypothetical protein
MSAEYELKYVTYTFFGLKPTAWKVRKKEERG